MNVVLIEHDAAELLYPFTQTHCAWELRAGFYTIAERWKFTLQQCTIHVHSDRQSVESAYRARSEQSRSEYGSAPLLIIAANLLVAPSVMRQMHDYCVSVSDPVHFTCNGETVGVYLPEHNGQTDGIASIIEGISGHGLPTVQVQGHIVTRLWQILDRLEETVAWDAELVQSRVAKTASVHQTAVLDRSKGPIIIGDGATIGAFCIIQGPAVIGEQCNVKPHSHINTVVAGPQCRISGEIANTVFQAYSNKQHAGFIGHSYIGEWVNLGAGTTTSNLKNTYSHVRPEMPWGREDSQRVFLGSLVGDYCRTGIGTMLPTGGVYGACAAINNAGTAPRKCDAFSWDDKRYELDKALATIEIAMKRRGKVLTDEEQSLLVELSERNA